MTASVPTTLGLVVISAAPLAGEAPPDSTPTSSRLREPAATQPPDTTEPQPWRARLVFTGDILSHGPDSRQARANGTDGLTYDYRPMFAEVQASLSEADLAICHLESPLSPHNEDLSGFPLFNVPGDLAVALASAGYDGCSTASNHALDQGAQGIAATLGLLERAGLGHAGTARTPEEAAAPTLYDIRGVTIAHLSYTYGLNGLRLPPDQPWAVDVIDAEAIEAKAQAASMPGRPSSL